MEYLQQQTNLDPRASSNWTMDIVICVQGTRDLSPKIPKYPLASGLRMNLFWCKGLELSILLLSISYEVELFYTLGIDICFHFVHHLVLYIISKYWIISLAYNNSDNGEKRKMHQPHRHCIKHISCNDVLMKSTIINMYIELDGHYFKNLSLLVLIREWHKA